MTLANKITLLRILLIPVFIITLIQGVPFWPTALFLFTITTDALDGFIARWKKQITPLGTFLDPLADKLLMFSTFVTLAYLEIIPLWICVAILSRDLLIVIGWLLSYFITGSKEIKPRVLGKITTIFQMVTLLLVLLQLPEAVTDKLLVATVAITTISGLDYIWVGSHKLGKHA